MNKFYGKNTDIFWKSISLHRYNQYYSLKDFILRRPVDIYNLLPFQILPFNEYNFDVIFENLQIIWHVMIRGTNFMILTHYKTNECYL